MNIDKSPIVSFYYSVKLFAGDAIYSTQHPNTGEGITS